MSDRYDYNYNIQSDLYRLHRNTEDGAVNPIWKRSERPHCRRILEQSIFKKSEKLERAFQEGRTEVKAGKGT